MITTLKGDITRLGFDYIVNDAKKNLMVHPGICSAIFKRAGTQLEQECSQLKGCLEGQVVLTHPYNLACKGIIHAVSGYYIDGEHQEWDILEACYWNALALAYKICRKEKLASMTIAIPPLGVQSGYPRKEACQCAVKTVQKLFWQYPEAKMIDVIFVCENQRDYTLYKEELNK